MPLRPTNPPSANALTRAGQAKRGVIGSASRRRLKTAWNRAPSPSWCASAANSASVNTPSSTPRARVEQRPQQGNRIAACAAAGVVGHVGENPSGSVARAPRFAGPPHRVVERHQAQREALAAVPDFAGQRERTLARGMPLSTNRGHHDGKAALRAVGQREAAAQRHVLDVARHGRVGQIDQLAIGRARRDQLGRRRRHERQPDSLDHARALAPEPHQRPGGVDAAFMQVDMRVGAIGDERRQRARHPLGHVGMQIEHRDDWHVGAHRFAHRLEQLAVGILATGGQRRAMSADEYAVDRRDGTQPGDDLVAQRREVIVFDRPAWLRRGHAQGHRRPRPRRAHRRQEPDRVGQHAR